MDINYVRPRILSLGHQLRRISFEWEEWTSQFLLSAGIDNELQSNNAPYDILALDNVRIDVKVTTKLINDPVPYYQFKVNTGYDDSDIYFCIIADSKDIFVIPNNDVFGQACIGFRWPLANNPKRDYKKYHNQLDYIYVAHLNKL